MTTWLWIVLWVGRVREYPSGSDTYNYDQCSQETRGQGSDKKWGSILDAQFKPGTRIFGGGDLMVPLWQDSSTLMFFDARGWFSDLSTEECNLGVVVRKQISCQHIIGVYGFYDCKNSEYDNYFHGGSLGAEFLSREV